MITGRITGLRCVTSLKYRLRTRRTFCCRADGSVTCASADSFTDWITRTEHILARGADLPFVPFDREAMLRDGTGRSLAELLDTFATLRTSSLARLAALRLTPADLDRPGLHPALGPVTLGQLLATWVAHDLGHLAQIARVLGKRYRETVGPWREFLPFLDR